MNNYWLDKPDLIDEYSKALGEYLKNNTKFWYQGKADTMMLMYPEADQVVTYIVPVIKFKYDNRDVIENWDDLWDENAWKENLFSFHKNRKTTFAYLKQTDAVSEPALGYFYGLVKIKEYMNEGSNKTLVINPTDHSVRVRLRSCYASAYKLL